MNTTRIPTKHDQGNDMAERLVRAYPQDGDVVLASSTPGFSWYHPMTPTQARELAVALSTYADIAEVNAIVAGSAA